MNDNKIVVLNLPLSYKANDARKLFKEYGVIIKCDVMRDKSGKSKFAFLSFAENNSAIKALEKNNTVLGDNTIQVERKGIHTIRIGDKEFIRRDDRRKEQHTKGRSYDDTNKIMVSQIPFDVKKDELEALFSRFGPIEHCAIMTHRETGKSRGMGVVKFSTEEAMQTAIREMDGYKLKERELVVRKYLSNVEVKKKERERKDLKV